MKRFAIGKALVLCAAGSLPALAAAQAGQPTTSYAAGNARVIVKYREGGVLMRESALAAGESARVSHAARMSQRIGLAMRDGATIAPRTQVLHARGLSSEQLVSRLSRDPEVEQVEIDVRVKRTAAPNDPLYGGGQPVNITPTVGQWYLRPPSGTVASSINAEAAWDVTTGSPSVIVAVLDTGVRPDHPDLVGKLLPGYDFVTADSDGSFATANDGNGRDPDPSDPGDWVTQAESDTPNGPLEGCVPDASSWHGTQTAALVGASTNNSIGMASTGRNVQVLPVRVLGKCGGFLSDVVAGMRWAAGLSNVPVANPNPAKVLNLSLGSTGTCAGTLYASAVAEITNAGVAVVVSAGNDVGQAVGRPANCPGAIGVGGLRHVGTKVGFSDVGPELALSAPGGNCVNLSGPCLFPILTATNAGSTSPAGNTYTDGLNNISAGTSFSSPLVAGAAGLMLSVNAALTPAQLRLGLQRTSRAFPTSGAGAIPVCRAPDATEQDECYCTTSTCGAGMLDVAGAVNAANALKAWIVPATTQTTPGASVSLDGGKSWASPSSTITSHQWQVVSGPGTLQATSGAATALNATSAGTIVVRLTVTDGSGQASDELAIAVANGSSDGGGGGALSWPWLLALGAALALLRPRRNL